MAHASLQAISITISSHIYNIQYWFVRRDSRRSCAARRSSKSRSCSAGTRSSRAGRSRRHWTRPSSPSCSGRRLTRPRAAALRSTAQAPRRRAAVARARRFGRLARQGLTAARAPGRPRRRQGQGLLVRHERAPFPNRYWYRYFHWQ